MALLLFFTVKKRLKLEVKFKGRIQAAIEYVKTIEDFNEVVDPRTFTHHCLGLEPFFISIFNSPQTIFFFSLEMMTKFNQEMYAQMKEKKNELLFNIG